MANITQYGYFWIRDDAQRPEIDFTFHFKIQEGGFWFLENSQECPNTAQYGYFWNRDDVQRLEIDYRRHFEIEGNNFRFLENSFNRYVCDGEPGYTSPI